jgi:uncharacterized membrane protein YcaP (DUF421 family)
VEPGHVAVRAVLGYLILLALVRVAGKRVVAEGTPFDFILALALGDMVDDLLWADVGAAKFTVAVATLTLAHTTVSWVQAASPAAARLVNLTPTVLLKDGELVPAGLHAERLRDGDVEALTRLRGIGREAWREVAAARLEENGMLSALLKPSARSAQRKDRSRARRR